MKGFMPQGWGLYEPVEHLLYILSALENPSELTQYDQDRHSQDNNVAGIFKWPDTLFSAKSS
jgi:hypothetical protein